MPKLKKFEPLDDNIAETLVIITNQVLHNDLNNVTPDGVKSLEVNAIQVKTMFKALWMFNEIARKLEGEND